MRGARLPGTMKDTKYAAVSKKIGTERWTALENPVQIDHEVVQVHLQQLGATCR
mgnify:CR=1 FL=1